jgi:uncharacterized membrane protein
MVRLARSERRLDVAPLVRLGAGSVVGLVLGVTIVWPSFLSAVLAGWAAAAAVFVAWTWAAVGTMDAEQTRAHATREEPTRPGAEAVLVVAALLSLGGVAGVLFGGHSREVVPMAATLAAVLTSWAAIHTVFALRYARLYFADDDGGEGGIDFHQAGPPRYSDFAYLAFTVGMSFAISDTDLASWRMRRNALRHALLAYLFGTVIIALIINITAGA